MEAHPLVQVLDYLAFLKGGEHSSLLSLLNAKQLWIPLLINILLILHLPFTKFETDFLGTIFVNNDWLLRFNKELLGQCAWNEIATILNHILEILIILAPLVHRHIVLWPLHRNSLIDWPSHTLELWKGNGKLKIFKYHIISCLSQSDQLTCHVKLSLI